MSNDFEVSRWRDEIKGVLELEEALKLKAGVRISRKCVDAGMQYQGASVAGSCYVVDGAIELKSHGVRVSMSSGECSSFPPGDYQITVMPGGPADMIFCWTIPTKSKDLCD